VKLLFDENLSRKLVIRLSDLFPDSKHVESESLAQVSDRQIWEYAKNNDFTNVTAEGDFHELVTTFGPAPKVIWLRGCDYPTSVAEKLIRSQAIRVAEFEESEASVLILRP
jgi:predicted nuclease of predicted toxin-antitoxin system